MDVQVGDGEAKLSPYWVNEGKKKKVIFPLQCLIARCFKLVD